MAPSLETPLVQIVDDGSGKHREKYDRILADVEKAPAVLAARAELDKASDYLARLKPAIGALNYRSAELFGQIRSVYDGIEERILDNFVTTGKLGSVEVTSEILALQAEESVISRTMETAAIHRLPLAQIAEVEATYRHSLARAKEIERVAQQHFERTTELLRGAVQNEGSVSVDIRQTISGTLLNVASTIHGEANRQRENAERLRKTYDESVQAIALRK